MYEFLHSQGHRQTTDLMSPSLGCPLHPRKRTNRRRLDLSALCQADSSTAAKISSFDNIISARKQCRRQFETERLGGLEVDEQLNFCGLLDGQIGQVLALEPGRYKHRPNEMIP